MDPDLRHLRLVVAVADAGSLSAAARALGTTQPAVSNQLRRLEEALDGELFERSAQGVVPTERGRAVLRRARTVLEQMDRITDVADPARAPASVRVRTFVLPFELMLPLMQHFVPGTRWEVVAGSHEEGLDAVTRGEADLFYGLLLDEDAPPPPGVVVEEVLHERGWIMLPAGHRLAAEPVVELADLAGETWVSRPEPELSRAMLRDLHRVGVEPDVRFRATDPASMVALVASGAAVALVSPVVDVTDGVVIRPCSGTRPYSWVLAHRPAQLSPTVVHVVRDLVRWAYRHRADANAELVRTLPADLLAVRFPAPLEPAAP
jgi:DNA-binding transcriptional LysR family regulator